MPVPPDGVVAGEDGGGADDAGVAVVDTDEVDVDPPSVALAVESTSAPAWAPALGSAGVVAAEASGGPRGAATSTVGDRVRVLLTTSTLEKKQFH